MKTKTKALLALLPLVAFPSIASSSGWDSFWSAIGETLPASVSDSDEGYFSKTWDGLKTIMRDGNTGLLVPAYTIHPAWDYPNRRQENGYTWGGGISSNYIDARGNRRILYAMAFSDSHNIIEQIGRAHV